MEHAPHFGWLDAWAGPAGSARHELFAPLLSRLAIDPFPPADLDGALAPLRTLLGEARAHGIPLDGFDTLDPDFAAALNDRLGFDTPHTTPQGERAFLEVDALHLLSVDMELLESRHDGDRLTQLGGFLSDQPRGLWRAVAHAIGSKPGPLGAIAEIVLAALLQRDELGEQETTVRARRCLVEAAGGEPILDLSGWSPLLEITGLGSAAIQTLARGLSMLESNSVSEVGMPRLTAFGEVTARAALRSAVVAMPTGKSLLPHAPGALN